MRCLSVLTLMTGFILSSAILAKTSESTAKATAKTAGPVKEAVAEYLPNTFVLKFKNRATMGESTSATGITSLDGLMAAYQVTEMKQIMKERAFKSSMVRNVAIESIYEVFYRGDVSPVEVARAFSQDPNIEYAEPRYLAWITDTPNDPQFGSMEQFSQVFASEAWDVVKGESGDVVIAIVDGGTDWDHPDLINNIWNNADEIPNNNIDDDNNGFIDDVRGWNFANDSNDPTGLPNTPSNRRHGTHVAGTAAGVTNNGTGVASMSWNCKIMPINSGSPTRDNAISFPYVGILYAALNGADIINASWGNAGLSRFEQDIIDIAHDNGALVISSAGNDASNNDITPQSPADYSHVLSVGSTNKTNDIKSGFSNYGVSVDVFAPGSSILSTIHGGGYGTISGTSMSAPMVSGLAGLIKTLRPEYTVDELREQIRVTCDAIDGVNPGFSGRLGKGRINARRAVTDFSIPAIRMKNLSFIDSGGDGIIDASEAIDLSVNFINYLAAASNINIELTTSDNRINITNSTVSFSALANNEQQTGDFRFVVLPGTPEDTELLFVLEIDAGSYTDREIIVLTVSPPPILDHNTGSITTSLTLEGNIGFDDIGGLLGSGFLHNGNNYLFEAGLLIGRGSNQVSDCIRDATQSEQEQDFVPANGAQLTIVSPGQIANEEGIVLITDSAAANPLGVSIEQKSYADMAAENQQFIIFQYTVLNNNASDLTNVHVGLWFDWDVNLSANDYARYDASRSMGYVMNNPTPTQIAATRLLSSNGNVNYRAIHNPNEIYDGFTKAEKWNFMSSGIQTQSLENVDVSSMLTEGPLTIPANGSVEVVFALVAANSMSELETNADRAQAFWLNPTSIDDPVNPVATDFQLAQNFPNPFNPETTIRYTIPRTAEVQLEIYNALGQRVRTLVAGTQNAGAYDVVWNGRNDVGEMVSSGIYLYRLRAGNSVLTRKMLLMQ